MKKGILKRIGQLIPAAAAILAVVLAVTSFPAVPKVVQAETEKEPVNNQEDIELPAGEERASEEPEGSKDIGYEEVSDDGYEDGVYYGVGTGFAGKIKVKVVITNSSISSIELVEVEADDAEYVDMAKGVISKILRTQNTNVDVVSGATYSSNGIIMAVRDALRQAAKIKTESADESIEEKIPVVNEPSAKWKDGTYTGKAKVIPPENDKTWFEYELTIKVTIQNGKVTNISDISHDSTGTLGVINSQFTDMAAKKILPYLIAAQGDEGVDIVSGATCSSEALKQALKDALLQAEKAANQEESSTTEESGSNEEETDSEETTNPGDSEEPGETEEPEEPTQPGDPEKGELIDGTYTGIAPVELTEEDVGWEGYQLYLTISVKNGLVKDIGSITIDSTGPFAQLNGVYTDIASEKLIPQLLNRQGIDGVDVVSGATRSSAAILRAYEQAIEQARKPETAVEKVSLLQAIKTLFWKD